MATEPLSFEACLSAADFERRARAVLPTTAYDFVAGGVGEEISLHRNRAAIAELELVPRVLTGRRPAQLETSLLGTEVTAPIAVAPMGLQSILHADAELATVRAAGSAGVLMVVSSGSSTGLEDVARHSAGPLWFQQYLFRDRGLTDSLAQRAADAGYRALCVTVDAAVTGRRERLMRNGFSAPPQPNLAGRGYVPASWDGDWREVGGPTSLVDSEASWDDLARLCGATQLPVVVKGIVHPADAAAAADSGARAVVVSNHGGRQLDTVQAPIRALAAVRQAAPEGVEVYVDGGFRRGVDIAKALALGAHGVFVGRPVLWALAVGGEEGVLRMLRLLIGELRDALTACGQLSSHDVATDLLADAGTSMAASGPGNDARVATVGVEGTDPTGAVGRAAPS